MIDRELGRSVLTLPRRSERSLMAKRQSYAEGDVFAVPLSDGGYAVGVVARVNRDGVVLGYFFGPRRVDPPQLAEVDRLEAVDHIFVATFGDLGLSNGHWEVAGRLPAWQRWEWPVPAFGRHEELTGRYLRVEYSDDDPNSNPRETEIARDEFEHLPEAGVAGFRFVSARLSRLLAA